MVGNCRPFGIIVRGAGSAMGRTDPTRWAQEHGGGRQQACTRSTRRWRPARAVWTVPGASVTLSRFEALEVNAQSFDFRVERLPRQAQFGRGRMGLPPGRGTRTTRLR
jgi:hypothetical protein